MLGINFGKGRSRIRETSVRRRPERQTYRLTCEALEERFLLSGQAAWTVMVYVTADNQLASGLNGNIKQMESALAQFNTTSTPGSVQFAVLYDQSQSTAANLFKTPIVTANGVQPAQTWSNTGEAVLQPNAAAPDSRDITTPFKLIGTQNTGKPAVLTQFVTWAAATAPADHYALIFEDHGAGWRGFNNYSDDSLKTPAIATVLNNFASAAKPVKFDLVGFDECLMADAQAELPLAASTPVIVASEELESGTGWNFTTALNALDTANPGDVTSTQIATSIVNSFATQYGKPVVDGSKHTDTLSAVKTSALANLNTALKAFTTAALDAGATTADWNTLAWARNQAPWYSEGQPEGYRDLGRFLSAVAAAPGVSPALQAAALNASQALAQAIIVKTADTRQSSGLTVYFPGPGETVNTDYFDPNNAADPGLAAAFVNDTNWFNFLKAFLAKAPAQAVTPASFVGSGGSRSASQAFDFHDLIGPNNSFAGLSLPVGDGTEDEQWFSFTLAAAGVTGNSVTASYPAAGGTVHLSLFDQDSNLLAESNTGTGQESISLAGLPAGKYYVSVASGNGQPVIDFDLAVNAPTPETIPADYAIGNSTQAGAFNLGSIASVAEFSGLTLETGATDWFRFNLAPNPIPTDSGPISLTVQGSNDQSLSVQILDQAGNVLASDSGNGALTLTYPHVNGGQYFLKVSGDAGGYALHFNPPLLDANSLDLSENPIIPGKALILDGTVEEFAGTEAYTVTVNWGDGSAQTVLTLPTEANNFQTSHSYVQPGRYSIVVSAVAATGLTGNATITATISDLTTVNPPVITNPEQQLFPLALAFVKSAEFERTFVQNEYQTILKRGAENAGLTYWVAQMQAGLTQEGLTAHLLSSQEFIAHSGAGAAWIGEIYKTLFNRQADATGMAFWNAQLQLGVAPLAIAQTFTASAESLSRRISEVYTTNLGRSVDPAGLAFWLSHAQAIGAIDLVAVNLLASSEYYKSLQGGNSSPTQWIDSIYSLLFNRQPTTSEESYWLGQLS